jgi:hypothetical protein
MPLDFNDSRIKGNIVLKGLFLILITCYSLSGQAQAPLINVMTLNAEWLWTPFDGKAEGTSFNKGDMSKSEYQKEVRFYADIVLRHDVHMLTISEIENAAVARDIAERLGPHWHVYFKQGRDTATGQDVAILSRLESHNARPSEANDYGFPAGYVAGYKKPKRLSKLVGVHVNLAESSTGLTSLNILTSHFLSKRNESPAKRAKRWMQAEALVNAANRQPVAQATIVAGDLNDWVRSKTLQTLQDKLRLKSVLTDCRKRSDAADIKKNVRSEYSVDHILFRGLKCIDHYFVDLKDYSDHPGLIARFVAQ